jgi:hypothetical protein
MADDKTKKGTADAVRINIGEAYEVTYWTNKLGVTPEQLKAAAAKVGPMSSDIARELGK